MYVQSSKDDTGKVAQSFGDACRKRPKLRNAVPTTVRVFEPRGNGDCRWSNLRKGAQPTPHLTALCHKRVIYSWRWKTAVRIGAIYLDIVGHIRRTSKAVFDRSGSPRLPSTPQNRSRQQVGEFLRSLDVVRWGLNQSLRCGATGRVTR